MQVTFALVGFVIVLLPTLSKNWRAVIEKTPVAAQVYQDFSSLSGLAMLLLYFLMGLFLVWNGLKNKLPAGQTPLLSKKDIVEMELYPRNKSEEFAYWLDFVLSVTGTTLWLFLPFGVLAFFIRMGG